MIFTVIYRNKEGKRDSLVLDVPNRDAVWAELKARGISAISVKEGAEQKRVGNGERGMGNGLAKGLLAGVAVVALAIGAWVFLTDGPERVPSADETQKTRRVKEVKPAKPKQPKPAETDKAVPAKPAPVEPTAVAVEEPKSRKAPSTAKKYPRRVIPRKPEPPQKFKYDSDDLIGAFLEIVPGTPMEGGLRFDRIGRDFEKSLAEDVALAEGQDNEYNRQLREYVRETKKEILEVMRKENKTFGQVMQEQFDQLIEMGQYRRDLEMELRQIRKSGEYTADEYDKFIEASNKMLESRGCSPLKVPKATYYQLERYRKMREAREAEAAAEATIGN